MEIENIADDESLEQMTLANTVEDFLTKVLNEYPKEYYVEITVGNDNPHEIINPVSKTFRGSK